MKYITDRKEIAKFMNSGNYPVVQLEIGKCVDGYENLFHGSSVNVACTTKTHGVLNAHCELTFERTEENVFPNKIELTSGGCCLKSSFGYNDIMDMMKWANVPTLEAGQEVVVILNNSEYNACLVTLYKMSDRVDLHCMVVATLEEINE